MCVWAALSLPMFVSCGDDDESENVNVDVKTEDMFVSEILVNQTVADLYDVEVSYVIKGDTLTEVVDVTKAERETVSLSGDEYELLATIVSKEIKDRPVRVMVNARPKESFDALLDGMGAEKVDLVYLAKCKNVKPAEENAYSKIFSDFSVKTSLGVKVDKLKENKRVLPIGSLSVD